jgi:hypothetical protein
MDQVCLWAAHLALHGDPHNLCVPDLGSCVPEILAPREIRRAYMVAYVPQFEADLRRAWRGRRMVRGMNRRFMYLLVLARLYVTLPDDQ